MEWVLEEAVASGQSIVVAPEDGAVGEDEALEQVEVVLADGITDINRPAGDGSRGGMKLSTRVRGLEHIPVRVDEVAHP